MLKVSLFLFTFMVANAFATDLIPLKIVSLHKNKKQFSFERREGDLPHYGMVITDLKKKKLFDIKVIKCGPKNCLGEISVKHTGQNLSLKKSYLHEYNTPKKIQEAPPEEAPYVSEHAPPPMGEVYSAYLGYGSPVGSAVKAGFFRLITKKTMVGPTVAMVSDETDMVSLKATTFSFLLSRNLIKITENFDFNFLGEFGIAKAKLDFSGVSSEGPKQEESTYLLGVGGELKYHIGPVALAGRGGVSKTGFKNEYENLNRAYKNPYGKVLTYVEFGIYYTF